MFYQVSSSLLPWPLSSAGSCLWRMRVVTPSTSGIPAWQKMGIVFLSFFGKRPLQRGKSSHRLLACVSVPAPGKPLQFGSELSHLHTEYCVALDTAQQHPWDHCKHSGGSSTSGRFPTHSLDGLKTSSRVLPPFTLAKGWIPP